jgi:hypothetical protein
MTLSFPNRSRSFDATKSRVRFWGYDSAIEISFFLETDALQKLIPEMSDAEAGVLKAFDATRERIYEVAARVYARNRKASGAYILAADDF